MDKAEVFYPKKPVKKKLAGDETPGHGGGWAPPVRDLRTSWPRGFRGNPTFATKETGETLLDIRARWLADLIRRDLV